MQDTAVPVGNLEDNLGGIPGALAVGKVEEELVVLFPVPWDEEVAVSVLSKKKIKRTK